MTNRRLFILLMADPTISDGFGYNRWLKKNEYFHASASFFLIFNQVATRNRQRWWKRPFRIIEKCPPQQR